MTEEEIVRLAMARMAADHDWQCANFCYLLSLFLTALLGAAFVTGRVYQMRSDKNERNGVGVYAPEWRPSDER